MRSVFFIVLAASSFQIFAQQDSVQTTSISEIDELIQSYQFKKALTLLATREDSFSTDVLQRTGYCYHQLGNYNEAISAYESVSVIDSTNTRALLALGQLYARQKQFGGSVICYTRLISMDSLNSYYYKQYGLVAMQAHLPGVAFANFSKAIALNPTDIESNAALAEILIDGDQPGTAENLLSKALALTSSPQLSYLLARAQMDGKKYRQAIKTTTELMMRTDTLPAHARIMGISHYRLENFEEAIRWMKMLLEGGMTGESIYYYIGMSYQKMNRQDSAIFFLSKAIEEGISENIGNYHIQLATSYEAINNFKMAIKYYKAAYEETKSGILLYHLARNYDIYYKDKDQAIAYFKRYLESDDTIKLAREYSRQRVNELEFYR